MKFTVSQSALLEALIAADKCIGNSIMPILSCYRFNIDGDSMQITGGNMEVFMSCDLTIQGAGFQKSIAIPAERLMGLVKELPDQGLEFTITEKIVKTIKNYIIYIKAASGKYEIPGDNGENYPMIRMGETVDVSLPSQSLVVGVDKTAFAAHHDPTLVYNSVYMAISGKEVTFAATNRFIFSTLTYELDTDLALTRTVLIPPKVLTVLRSTKCSDIITVSLGNRSIRFKLSETTVLDSMLMEGTFPDYKEFIPVQNDKHIAVGRTLFSSALKRVSQFSDMVTMRLEPNKVVLNTRNDSQETAVEELAVDYAGEPLTIIYNGKYMITCLTKTAVEEVHLSMGLPKLPLVLRDVPGEYQSTQNLMMVMPSTL